MIDFRQDFNDWEHSPEEVAYVEGERSYWSGGVYSENPYKPPFDVLLNEKELNRNWILGYNHAKEVDMASYDD